MQGPDNTVLPCTRIAGEFAAQTKKLQCSRRLMAQHLGGNYEGDVFGGYVRSYGFNHDPNSDFAHGKMWIDFTCQIHAEVDVTVVILGGGDQDRKTALNMVQKTSKLAEVSDLVLDAYFCTFVESLGLHVVVYERFDSYFFGGGEPVAGPFFLDSVSLGQLPARKFSLTPFWVDKMRSFIDLLDYGNRRHATHGGLNNSNSYVVSFGTIKLINVGRYTEGQYIVVKDVTDLRTLIKTNHYFDGSTSDEWCTFDKLLGSHLVTKFGTGWKDAVVGHPILQDSADATIAAFDGVHKSIGELGPIGATKLGNLLKIEFPFFYKIAQERKADTPLQRKEVLLWFFPPEDYTVLGDLFDFIFPGTQGITYGGKNIYLEVINLSRNFIHHAADYDKRMNLAKNILRKMRDYFTHYISAAYTLLHMLDDDPTKTKGPYDCKFMRKPTKSVSLGSLVESAKPMKCKK